jgi:hypothetical protein
MTVFGHPVLFDFLEKREDTASEKTPKQWHKTRTLNLDNALGLGLTTGSWLTRPSTEMHETDEMTTLILI